MWNSGNQERRGADEHTEYTEESEVMGKGRKNVEIRESGTERKERRRGGQRRRGRRKRWMR